MDIPQADTRFFLGPRAFPTNRSGLQVHLRLPKAQILTNGISYEDRLSMHRQSQYSLKIYPQKHFAN